MFRCGFALMAILHAGDERAALRCFPNKWIRTMGLRGTGYWEIAPQLTMIGAGLGLLVPPLTSTLLGSVEKSRSGIAAGVLNATRQTGSVLGVALFGSLVGQADAFIAGTHEALIISACLLLVAATAIWRGASRPAQRKMRAAEGHRSAKAQRR
jgi:DHA2 family methylenomycin A resistance protein-like MFS transporter